MNAHSVPTLGYVLAFGAIALDVLAFGIWAWWLNKWRKARAKVRR